MNYRFEYTAERVLPEKLRGAAGQNQEILECVVIVYDDVGAIVGHDGFDYQGNPTGIRFALYYTRAEADNFVEHPELEAIADPNKRLEALRCKKAKARMAEFVKARGLGATPAVHPALKSSDTVSETQLPKVIEVG